MIADNTFLDQQWYLLSAVCFEKGHDWLQSQWHRPVSLHMFVFHLSVCLSFVCLSHCALSVALMLLVVCSHHLLYCLSLCTTPYFSLEGLPTYSIYISSFSLRELSLTSLRQVKDGYILIERNPELCYVDEEMWKMLLRRPKKQSIIIENNKPADQCSK